MMQEYFKFIDEAVQGLAILQQLDQVNYRYNPRTCVYQKDKIKLYHYQHQTKKICKIPLLIVFSTVNRPEILDLLPEQSLIGELLRQGMDIYLLDWGYPDQNDKNIYFNKYITEYLHQCVQYIIKNSKQEQISLLGVCQGGIICLCYATLFSYIKNLILISTPINFHTKNNIVSKFIQKIETNDIGKIDSNISGNILTQFFISLRPFELLGKKYLKMMENISDKSWIDKFLLIEKWLHDAPDQPNKAFVDFVNDYYQENKLIHKKISVDGHLIDLSQINLPVLNIMAKEDQLVPMSASKALKKYIHPQYYSTLLLEGGHIGIYVSKKHCQHLTSSITKWLSNKS